MSAATFGPIRQIAWVVNDLDLSVRNWLRSSGLGPWTCFRNVAMTGTLRGEGVTVRMHVALGYQGDMEIELIQPLGAGPSPYRGSDGAPRVGMHHVAWFSEDVAADVARGEQRGLRQLFAAANPVTRVAYLEDPREPGLLLEFIEMNALMRAGLEARLAAARDWRGEEPIRSIDLGG
ncbi:MAG TPA: VOC family protein [Steroidobacteraceae bacterium]|nr:VOC family protein [Steroidobacteraceae bacterium]